MTTVNLYSVFTTNDNKFKTIWNTTEPIVGPNGEPIDPQKTSILDSVSKDNVMVHEPTVGHFQCISIEMDIPAGEPGSKTYIDLDDEWPMDVVIWKTELVVKQSMVGDELCVINDPDKSIGFITDDVLIDDKVIKVSDTVLEYANVGFDVTLDDRVHKIDLGRIIDINKNEKTITVEKPVTTNFYHLGSGTLVLLNLCMIRNYILDNPGVKIQFGEKGFRGSALSKDTRMRAIYTNNNGQAKKWYWRVEYYFGQKI